MLHINAQNIINTCKAYTTRIWCSCPKVAMQCLNRVLILSFNATSCSPLNFWISASRLGTLNITQQKWWIPEQKNQQWSFSGKLTLNDIIQTLKTKLFWTDWWCHINCSSYLVSNNVTQSLSFLRACFLHSSLAPTHAHLLKHYIKHN